MNFRVVTYLKRENTILPMQSPKGGKRLTDFSMWKIWRTRWNRFSGHTGIICVEGCNISWAREKGFAVRTGKCAFKIEPIKLQISDLMKIISHRYCAFMSC